MKYGFLLYICGGGGGSALFYLSHMDERFRIYVAKVREYTVSRKFKASRGKTLTSVRTEINFSLTFINFRTCFFFPPFATLLF